MLKLYEVEKPYLPYVCMISFLFLLLMFPRLKRTSSNPRRGVKDKQGEEAQNTRRKEYTTPRKEEKTLA